MSAAQFAALQEILGGVFAPLIGLWITMFLVGMIGLSVVLVWLIVMREWLSKF